MTLAPQHLPVLDAAHRGDPAALAQLLRLSSVRLLAAFSGWLFQVVKRECHRLGRTALGHDPWDDERAEPWLASRDKAGLRLELVNALESLPADYLQVVLLRDFAEMSIAEIAAEVGDSGAAVKSRLHRARKMAREYLIG